MEARKPITFLGDSRLRVQAFSPDARREAGFQLERVQQGLDPEDWKPMATIGAGVREIRIRERSGAYRVIYLASSGTSVYVLHAFQKKSQKTAKREIDIARLRLRLIEKEWRDES